MVDAGAMGAATFFCEGIAMDHGMCDCGEPLHYITDASRRIMEELVREYGETVIVSTDTGSWMVPSPPDCPSWDCFLGVTIVGREVPMGTPAVKTSDPTALG